MKKKKQRKQILIRGENGEWNDFLEQRRPFVAPNPGSATH